MALRRIQMDFALRRCTLPNFVHTNVYSEKTIHLNPCAVPFIRKLTNDSDVLETFEANRHISCPIFVYIEYFC